MKNEEGRRFSFVAPRFLENGYEDGNQFAGLCHPRAKFFLRDNFFVHQQLQPIQSFVRLLQTVAHLGNEFSL